MIVERNLLQARLGSISFGDTILWNEDVCIVARIDRTEESERITPEGCVLVVRLHDGLSWFASCEREVSLVECKAVRED